MPTVLNFVTVIKSFVILVLFALGANLVEAASLVIQPATGVFQIGNVFTVRVMLNTAGASINAAEGTLSYNPRELSVVSVDRSGSIFSLWVTEPTFSNAAGTVSFSGGVPAGYTGNGQVFSITFRSLSAGSPRLSFSSGSVLANDGRGSNVIAGMSGGTYTVQAASSQPRPEVVQYVAPANTPSAPTIRSNTHHSGIWSSSTTAILSWDLPTGVTGVRTLLDNRPSSIPSRVYEDPIRTITLDNLPDGTSYFHIQFRNAEGWGRVAHFPLLIDTERPKINSVVVAPDTPAWQIRQVIQVEVEETVSSIARYEVQLPDGNRVTITADDTGLLTLPELSPGVHALVIEAFDQAGNSGLSSFTLQIESIAAPQFLDVPDEIGDTVIPVFRGQTLPLAEVRASIQLLGGGVQLIEVVADENGLFNVIPAGPLPRGVYEITASASDLDGAQSLSSDPVRFVVQPAGFVRLGMVLVSALSVIIPLIGLVVLLVLLVWFMIVYLRRLKFKVFKESAETVSVVDAEFKSLQAALVAFETKLANSKRSKQLSETELALVSDLRRQLEVGRSRVRKEAVDVEATVSNHVIDNSKSRHD